MTGIGALRHIFSLCQNLADFKRVHFVDNITNVLLYTTNNADLMDHKRTKVPQFVSVST